MPRREGTLEAARRRRRAAANAWALGALAALVWARPAAAETQAAPAGGAAVPLGGGRVACRDGSELRGWTLEADGAKVRPPASAPADEQPAVLRVVAAGQCGNSGAAAAADSVRAVVMGPLPAIDATSLSLAVDAGRLDVRGRNLRGMVLRWSSGSRRGSDVCRDVQLAGGTPPPAPAPGGTAIAAAAPPPPPSGGGLESCALTISRELSADPAATELMFLPAGLPGDGEVSIFDAQGRAQLADIPQMIASRVVLQNLLQPGAGVDAEADVGRVTLRHVEAIGSVECVDASCEVEGQDLLVRGERGSDELLEVRVRLRPHVFYQNAAAQEAIASLAIPLQRCPVALASAAPLRGVSGQKIVVRIGGRCQKDPAALRFYVGGAEARIVATQADPDSLFVLLQGERLGGEEVTVSMRRNASVVGATRLRSRVLPSGHVGMELPGIGPIDFIPNNREANVTLPPLGDGAYLLPLPVEGVYNISRDAGGADHIRAAAGATGWVALRLAYRDKSLPTTLREYNLAEISDTVDRAIKTASIPLTLGNDADPPVELVCNGDGSQPIKQRAGAMNSVAFADRESCRLILHRERLRPEDGEQSFRVVVTVNAADGLARPEANVDQVVRLRPGPTPRVVYIAGVTAPFDRVVVRVAVLSDDAHYAIPVEERVGVPPLQWSVIMGTSKVRMYATTAFPTGLFRVADEGHSGILGLNGGILFRGVWLTSEGQQSPVGLEAGMMWMGIAGDTTKSPGGQIAVVGGLSIGVPIANVSRATQASIALHAWLEYEVSRAVLRLPGRPLGFVFGPSLTIGAVGVNL